MNQAVTYIAEDDAGEQYTVMVDDWPEADIQYVEIDSGNGVSGQWEIKAVKWGLLVGVEWSHLTLDSCKAAINQHLEQAEV